MTDSGAVRWRTAPRVHLAPAHEAPTTASRRRRVTGAPAVCLALCSGTGLLATAYHVAASSPDLVAARYALFWVGLLLGVVPLLTVLLTGPEGAAPRRRSTRLALLALGLYTALPKLLRSPHDPVLYDEQLHISQAEAMVQAGTLFGVANPVVTAVEHYPLLHGVLFAGQWLSGAPMYHVGLVVVVVAHVAALFAVAAIARAMGAEGRTATLAGGVYALTPGYSFFSTMVVYQSLALPLALWTVVAALGLHLPHTGRTGRRAVRLALALLGAGAVVLTHHLTAFALIATLVTLAVGRLLCSGRSRMALTEVALLGLLVAAATTVQLVSAGGHLAAVGGYLFPGLDAIAPSLLPFGTSVPSKTEDLGHAARGAFSGSALPGYEQLAGFAAPLVVTGLASTGALLGRRRLTAAWGRRIGLGTLGAYLATMPLIFSARGAMLAHRAWPFLMVLLAPLLAAGVLEVRERLATASWPRTLVRRWRDAAIRRWPATTPAVRLVVRVPSTGLALALLVVLFMGNTATEVNDHVRFPGQHQVGADGRASDRHTLAAADWLRRTHGRGARITSDMSTAMSFVATAGAWKVRAYPTWELVMDPSSVGVRQLSRTAARGVEYLVVDTRMANQLPARGYYYEEYEPKAFAGVLLTGPSALDDLYRVPWAELVFTSGPVQVYRLDPRAGGVRSADVRRAVDQTPQRLLDLDARAPGRAG